MKPKTRNIAQLIRQKINDIDREADVILYGSRARGDERNDSDWDILILTGYAADMEVEKRFRELLYDLELETGESFSFFVYSKQEWTTHQRITPLYHNVVEEGIYL